MRDVKQWVRCPHLGRWQTRWAYVNDAEAPVLNALWVITNAMRREIPLGILLGEFSASYSAERSATLKEVLLGSADD